MFCNIRNKIQIFMTDIKMSIWFVIAYLVIIPFITLLMFVQSKSVMTQGISCMADYIATINYGYFLDMVIVPITLVLIINIVSQNDTANFLIRQKNKSSLVLNKYINMFVLTVFISIYYVLVAVIISGLFTPVIINWSENTSYFYFSLNYTMDISFAKIIILTIIKKVFTFYLFSCIFFCLSLKLKHIFCYFIIIFLLAINTFRYITFYLTIFLNLSKIEQKYISTSYMILIFIIIPIICLLSILLSLKLIKRKDFL